MKVHQCCAILIFLHLYFSQELANCQGIPPSTTTTTTTTTTTGQSLAEAATMARPGCKTKCGNVVIPYPFGIRINSNCSINPSFDVSCDHSTPKLSVQSGDLEVIEISEDHVRIKNHITSRCHTQQNNNASINLTSTPYSLSNSNLFIVVGCDEVSVGGDADTDLFKSCVSYCTNKSRLEDGECNGIGCCQTEMAKKGFKSFITELHALSSSNEPQSYNSGSCGYAFLGDETKFKFRTADLHDLDFVNRTIQDVPLVLDWAVGNGTCDDSDCKGNASCDDSDSFMVWWIQVSLLGGVPRKSLSKY